MSFSHREAPLYFEPAGSIIWVRTIGMPFLDVLNDLKRKVRAMFSSEPQEPDDPDAPFALVGAPLKPRSPLKRSAIAVQPEP
jgi:hypothetical protein